MEGQVGNIFETQFRHTSLGNHYTPSTVPSSTVNTSTPDIKSKESKHVNHILRNSGIATGVGVVLLAPVMILAGRGKLPKPVTNFLNKKSANISKKIAELLEKPTMTKAEMIYLHSLQKTSNTVNLLKGLAFNVSPLKDVLFEKVLRKMGLGKVCNKITGFFEKMAVKMTNIAYDKSNNAFAVMKDGFSQANKKMLSNPDKVVEIKGVSKTVAEWAKDAEARLREMDSAYDYFRTPSLKKRYKSLAKKFQGLGSRVFEQTYGNLKEFLTSPKKWTTFISEDMVATDKLRYGRGISHHKRIITNTHRDSVESIEKLVASIKSGMDMTTKESVDIIKRLNKAVKSYKTDAAKEEVLSEIQSIIKDSGKYLSGTNYAQPTAEKIRKSLNEIKYIMESDKNGKVEELLEIYSHILPKEEFNTLKKVAQKSTSSLKDAVYTESEKFVDKMRDLKVGSALTDIGTGILLPMGTTAAAISMADTKEKKRSVGLNFGIPLLTGLLVSTWGTIAMYSAGPSLVLGLTTSTITNRVCSALDKHLKEKDAKKLQTTA